MELGRSVDILCDKDNELIDLLATGRCLDSFKSLEGLATLGDYSNYYSFLLESRRIFKGGVFRRSSEPVGQGEPKFGGSKRVANRLFPFFFGVIPVPKVGVLPREIYSCQG